MIGPLPGAESLNFRAEFGRTSSPIDIQLSGSNFEELQAVAEQLKTKLGTYPNVFDIEDSMSDAWKNYSCAYYQPLKLSEFGWITGVRYERAFPESPFNAFSVVVMK